jgi:cytochrome c553
MGLKLQHPDCAKVGWTPDRLFRFAECARWIAACGFESIGANTMKIFAAISLISLACAMSAEAFAQKPEGPPAWAYPVNPPDFKPSPDDGTLRHVPDSTAAFTLTQVSNLFFAPDWHPADHPPIPEIVAQGRKPDVFACGFCHRADGAGGPENASLAGLPKPYILQQITDFKSGARKSSVPKRVPPDLMISLSKAITEAEVETAAAYFAALKPKSIIKVVETDSVPKTFVTGWFLAAVKPEEKEPIGQRIIEVPEDLERYVSRDARSQFIAYVPVGSITKGEALVATDGPGKTIQCGLCHGPDLKGLGPLPSIAGRSPSYIVRQLYDFQNGTRTGEWSPLMAQVVANLSEEDLVSIAAYLATRNP